MSEVEPLRVDREGRIGLTRGEARSRRWQRVGRGIYLPREADATTVAARIAVQAARLSPHGAITGWASLWWQGAGYLDGTVPDALHEADVQTDPRGRVSRPVPLLDTRQLSPGPGAEPQRAAQPVSAIELRGIRCTAPERALLDEARLLPRWSADPLRELVVAIDLSCHAGLTSLTRILTSLDRLGRVRGRPLLRRAVGLASEHSASPQESRLRLIWLLDAALPAPVCNRRVLDLHGQLVAIPDLLDVEAGLVVEYDGSHHFTHAQRRRDVHREEALRTLGLAYLTVLAGDLHRPTSLAARLRAARERALRSNEFPGWRLGNFHSERDGRGLDQRLDRADRGALIAGAPDECE